MSSPDVNTAPTTAGTAPVEPPAAQLDNFRPDDSVPRAPKKKRKADDDEPGAKKAKVAPAAELASILEFPLPVDPYAKQVVLKNGKKTEYSELQPGMLLYHPARLVVRARTVRDGVPHLTVENVDVEGPTRQYEYRGDSLVSSQCYNCDQYTEVRKETMSSLARIIKDQVGDALTKIEFTKEAVPSEMAKLLSRGTQLIEALYTDPVEKSKQYKRLYERTQKGEYRIMRGYILRDMDMSAQESETGMVKFLDADLVACRHFAQRQINLKHVQAVVLNGVRYERK